MGNAHTIPVGLISSAGERKSWPVAFKACIQAARRNPRACRTRRVILALVIIWLLNIFDLCFTVLAHQAGDFVEANILASFFIGNTNALILFKLSALVLATSIFLTFRRRFITELSCWTICIIYLALSFIWVGYYTLISMI